MSAPVFEYFLEIPGTDDTANPIYKCLEYPPWEKAQRHLKCKKYVEFEARIKGHENIIKEYEEKQEKIEKHQLQ